MKVINLAEKQLITKNKELNEHPFFKEYFRLFNSNPCFIQDTNELMQPYSLRDVSKVISFLEPLAKDMLNRINNRLHLNIDLDLIVFFGDSRFDGHGILIDGMPYVFFDLNAVIPRLDLYNFKTIMTHEILHSIHYCLNPHFYRDNHNNVEEKYFKLLLSEGIATYISYVMLDEKIEDSYWFGFIDHEQVSEWVRNCENMKREIGYKLHNAVNEGILNTTLYHRLFGIEDFTRLTSYRLGYYYGAEIVRRLLEESNINDVLTVDYGVARKVIYDYFDH
ncbi:DUF5700 domain-containing putative Zn-dependent protease [Allobacillus sp. GCM10007491]|uniref:DUF2268 domain-containing protein n=1 Tax=Allobacillus saliphilus TaxID=2912308 RepID=A0A941HTT2_9BACI|nr:hypothetical protein [Allobacillus saliphilus]MBR7553599.1 hypothetical protein [Allobacillus saliphilus]